MSYGAGFRPDTYAKPVHVASALLGAATPAGRPISYLSQIGGIKNQGQTETCVAFTFVECIALRAAALGITTPRGSETGVYTLSLQLEQAFQGDTSQPLVDMGSQPALAGQGIRSFGVPSSLIRPFDPVDVTRKLSFADLLLADATLPLVVSGFAGISEGGDARVAKVVQALGTGIPVALSVPASSSEFESPDGQVLTAPTTWKADNHMVQLVDFRPKVSLASVGTYEFLIMNHWGPNWASQGLAWCDESFVQYSESLFIVDLTAKP